MVNLRRGIYTKEFKYTDIDGVEQTLTLRPLKGKDFVALYSVMNRFKDLFGDKPQDKKIDEVEYFEKLFESLDKETTDILFSACVNTIMHSYDGVKEEDVEDFVSTHFLTLFPVVITLSMSAGGK